MSWLAPARLSPFSILHSPLKKITGVRISRVLSGSIIYLSGLPPGIGRATLLLPVYMALQSASAYGRPHRCGRRRAFTPPFHPYRAGARRLFSVTLSPTLRLPVISTVRRSILSGLSSPACAGAIESHTDYIGCKDNLKISRFKNLVLPGCISNCRINGLRSPASL